MSDPWHNCLTEITSVAAVLAAVLSGLCAWLSYKLSSKIRNELKSDETVVVSRLIHPGLATQGHDECVITCTLFNKSKRKVFVNDVQTFDRQGKPIEITWSDRIDPYGNPERPCELIGIVDSTELFVRRNDGKEMDFCRLDVRHSFSSEPISATFDPMEEWDGQDESTLSAGAAEA